jgi:acyl-CoA synthetase (AMP-forming)/AMP-acid ligase II
MELDVSHIHEAIAAAVPDRECIVWRDRHLTWAEVTNRTRRLANLLLAHDLGVHADPTSVAPWESAQDHLALYMTNCNEYLEGMLGGYKARVAPFNVNYRYVADEIAYLLRDARTRAIIYHARYAPLLADVLPQLDIEPTLLLQVDDDSGNDLLPGALSYEDALATSDPSPPAVEPSPDDLYIVYTGGTTGMPKGALWRQADFLVSALGVRRRDDTDFESLDEIVELARRRELRSCPAPPLMHGAAHWNALSTWTSGGTVVMQDDPEHLDADDILRTIERERVGALNIVGDAFARPLLEALRTGDYDVSCLRFVVSGGAVLSSSIKRELTELVAGLNIVDIVGSSESGRQGVGTGTSTGSFDPSPTACVLSDDRRRRLRPGDTEVGWLAQTGRMPRGYLGDRDKTEHTFPTIDGVRYVVAGDRARLLAGGRIELLGRESVTINTGGEKVFAEEVELALKHHPAVYDALVVGRPSETWGQEVVAVVRLRDGTNEHTDDADLVATAAGHIARYKLPKAIIRVDHIERSASGKPDYPWARDVAVAALSAPTL